MILRASLNLIEAIHYRQSVCAESPKLSAQRLHICMLHRHEMIADLIAVITFGDNRETVLLKISERCCIIGAVPFTI
jgi:hypothetical protein